MIELVIKKKSIHHMSFLLFYGKYSFTFFRQSCTDRGERRPVLREACIGDRRAQIVASHLVPAHFFVLALWCGPVNCLQLRDQAAPPLVAFPMPEKGEEFVLAPLLLVKR